MHIFGANTSPLTHRLHYLSLVVPHHPAISNFRECGKHNPYTSKNRHNCTSSVVLQAALMIQWNISGKVLHKIKSAL